MKRAISVLLVVILAVVCGSTALAHGTQKEHDKDLKFVLFGNRDQLLQGDEKAAFQAVADAAAICIDQFSNSNHPQAKISIFDQLKEREGLSIEFSEINVVAGPNTHRAYSHRGWEIELYPTRKEQELWKNRRSILLDTVRNEFFPSNSFLSGIPIVSDWVKKTEGYSKQCDAFCRLVYYTHLLGDHVEAQKATSLALLMHLSNPHDKNSPGIIPELRKCLATLFSDQLYSYTFSALDQKLVNLAGKAAVGDVITSEQCTQNSQYASEVLDVLHAFVPTLLENEPFFQRVFR